MRTLARLIGFEAELVGEWMVEGCPRYLLQPRPRARWVNDATPTETLNFRTARYDCEFIVEGDPILATYRRVE